MTIMSDKTLPIVVAALAGSLAGARLGLWLGVNHLALAIAISTENFTSAIGTVVFIAYLSEPRRRSPNF